MLAICLIPNAVEPLTLVDRLDISWNNRRRVISLEGRVLSVQPDRTIEWKTIDHDGQYEQAVEDDRGWLVYHSGHDGYPAYVFPIFKSVPA